MLFVLKLLKITLNRDQNPWGIHVSSKRHLQRYVLKTYPATEEIPKHRRKRRQIWKVNREKEGELKSAIQSEAATV